MAIAVAQQIIDYLKNGTILNAVNAPSVTGELLAKVKPYLSIAEQIGCLQAQLTTGPLKEVAIEYAGDFHDMDLVPVSTAVLKGILTPAVKDGVNFVNAHVIAKDRDIKVTATHQFRVGGLSQSDNGTGHHHGNDQYRGRNHFR